MPPNLIFSGLPGTGKTTHQDTGKSPEAATAAVVAQSVKTAANNDGAKPSAMRKWLVGEVDAAIAKAVAPDASKAQALDDANRLYAKAVGLDQRSRSGDALREAAHAIGYVTFDVPGDGKFKVLNTPEKLREFKKKVLASSGFKDGGQTQDTRVRDEDYSGRNGSASVAEAIKNFLLDGDVRGALEFATVKGVEFTPVAPRMTLTGRNVRRIPASVASTPPRFGCSRACRTRTAQAGGWCISMPGTASRFEGWATPRCRSLWRMLRVTFRRFGKLRVFSCW